MRFTGQVAIVTGAARGIGLAIAEALAAEGAKVALFDLDLQEAQRQAERLTAGGSEACAYAVDVAEAAQVQAAVEAVVARWGRIDILVNNAGVPGPSAPLWEVTDAQWRRTLAIDLDGVFYCCRAVVPVMLQQGYGRIVNVASIAGKEGNPNLAPYSTAKAGVIGLTKSLGKELATRGVIVNAVTPAVIETDILKDVKPEVVQYMVSRIPMGRVGDPEEAADLIAYLLSDRARYITGTAVNLENLRRIMNLRLEETLDLVAQDVDKAGLLPHLRAGVLLCGGGARVPGLLKLAEQIFELPVALGRTSSISGLKSALDQPEFAAPIGLVKFASLKARSRAGQRSGWLRVKRFFREVFSPAATEEAS